MKIIKVSFLGLGTIGSKLMDYMRKNIETINSQYRYQINIQKVFVRNISKKRSIDVSDLDLTTDPYEAIEDADIVIECLGGSGVELTRELILTAIQNEKAVIMSSKKCLALYGKEILTAVDEYHTVFHYDATVGGCIPISSVFDTMGKCETVQKVYGICNGTSNFILSEMTEHHISYTEALKRAIVSGYSENNPQEDVDGYDALYKSIIIMGLGLHQWISVDHIHPITITDITMTDILSANKKNCVIKPVFYIERNNNEISVYIGPKLINKNTLLATVRENNNIIVVNSSESRERAFYGQGAGAKPSACAMYDDFIKTLREYSYARSSEYC